jgi:hypothetical protein
MRCLSEWLLGPAKPTDVTVYLIEADTLEPGAPLTPAVDAAMHEVAAMIAEEFWPDAAARPDDEVALTADGYLHLAAHVAARYFPGDALVARTLPTTPATEPSGASGPSAPGAVLELVPLIGPAHGGLVLRQRNAAGDRTVLIHEVLDFQDHAGRYAAFWDSDAGLLRVALTSHSGSREGSEEVSGDRRRESRGDPRAGSVGGPPGGGDGERGGAASPRQISHQGAGRSGGERDHPRDQSSPVRSGGVSQ